MRASACRILRVQLRYVPPHNTFTSRNVSLLTAPQRPTRGESRGLIRRWLRDGEPVERKLQEAVAQDLTARERR